jgi:hypothetical protein
MEKNNQVVYGIVNNIPQTYHSSDLRNFFSQFIETKGFKCFHFRHRPEKQISTKSSETENEVKTFCCVFRTVSERLDNLIRLYNKKHWLDKHGDSLSTLCYISKVSVSQNKGTCIIFPVSNNNKFGWNFISCHTTRYRVVSSRIPFAPLSRFFPIPVRPGSFRPHLLIVL